jgi:hypothetical protein
VADDVSNSTTRLVEMADNMSQQAEDLNELIEQFDVSETAGRGRPGNATLDVGADVSTSGPNGASVEPA